MSFSWKTHDIKQGLTFWSRNLAICLIETECQADFAPPLDYKEPEKPADVQKKEIDQGQPVFRPFTGTGAWTGNLWRQKSIVA